MADPEEQRTTKEPGKVLYTVVMEYRGGTYIAQIAAESVRTALREWASNLKVSEIAELDLQGKAELVSDVEDSLANDGPVLLNGLANAWCTIALVSKHLMLVNVIATISSKE